MLFASDDKEILNMKNGEWKIYCPEMSLVKNDGTKSWQGTGIIQWSVDRKLSFSLYTPCEHPTEAVFRGSFDDSIHSDKKTNRFLMVEADLYTLSATDLKCRKWEARQLSNFGYSAGSYPILTVRGTIRDVECHADISSARKALSMTGEELKNLCFVCYEFEAHDFPVTDGSHVEIKVAGEIKSSCSHSDVAKFSSSGFDFELMQSDCGLRCYAFSEKSESSPEILLSNIRESLQFVLGRPVEWDVIAYNCNVDECMRLASWKRKSGNARTPPPLRHSYLPSENEKVWRLYGVYFSHIQKLNRKDGYSEIAARLWNVMQASVGSWTTEKLTLATEIEGLIQGSFRGGIDPSLPMQEAAEKVAGLINAHLDQELSTADKDAVGRILSVLGNLKSKNSTLNILRHLAGQGVVRIEDVEAWQQVRHLVAHGHGIGSDLTDAEYQLCSRMYVLFYHLVFALIEYSGPYSDYGQPRAPNLIYGWAGALK